MTSKELLDKYVRACIEIDREEKNYIPMRPLIVSLKEKDNLEKEILKRIDEDDWHTGIPTEDGWYLIQTRITFAVAHMDKTGIRYDENGYWLEIYPTDIVAWQKIEPYKDTKEKKK